MFEKPSSKKTTYFIFYFLLIIFIVIVIGRFVNYKTFEKFQDFSPYNNPNQERAKVYDNVLLDKRLAGYEFPNQCSNGYEDLGSDSGLPNYIDIGLPPPNKLQNFPTLSFRPYSSPKDQQLIYGDPFQKNYDVGIMGGV